MLPIAVGGANNATAGNLSAIAFCEATNKENAHDIANAS